MAFHTHNMKNHILGHNDATPSRNQDERDARLDRLWAAHRVLATGTKGPRGLAFPSQITDQEFAGRLSAAPRIARPERKAS